MRRIDRIAEILLEALARPEETPDAPGSAVTAREPSARPKSLRATPSRAKARPASSRALKNPRA